MRHNVSSFSSIALLMSGLLLATPAVLAQMRGGGAPIGGQNGSMNQPGTSPNNMQPNGGMQQQNSPQANMERSFLADMRRNLNVETELSKLAVKNSSNDNVKKFAQQVISENRSVDSQLNTSASNDGMTFAPQVPSQTRKAEKQMKKLNGEPFDQMYLVQMDSYVKNDQQTTRNASATMSLPEVSDVGMRMRTLADTRSQEIAKLTQEAHFKIQ